MLSFFGGGFLGECPTRICKESELQSNHQIGPLSPLYLNKISYESAPSPTQEKKKKKKLKTFFFFFLLMTHLIQGSVCPDIFFFIAANSYCEDFFAIIVPVRVSPGLPPHIFASTKFFFIRSPRLQRARPSALLLSHPIYLFPPTFLYRYPIVFECCYDFLQIYLFR